MKRAFSWNLAAVRKISLAPAMRIRPARKPSRKPRLQSASGPSICRPRPEPNRAGQHMLRRLLQPVWVLLAIIFLIEAWLWDHLEPIVARVVAIIPLARFKQWLSDRVDTLSPAMTLIVFAVPVIPLFPLKLVGFWLLANQYWLSAGMVIVFGKLVGVGVTAFIFDVTRTKLLQMAWFKKTYEFIMAMRAKAAALVQPIKQRIREMLRGGGDSWSSRTLRLIARFSKSVHEAR